MPPVIHPGRLLKRELAARGLSANQLALDVGVSVGRITGILNGRRAITPDTAVRLSRYFGNKAQFWLDLQSQYEIAVIERDRDPEIAQHARLADSGVPTVYEERLLLYADVLGWRAEIRCGDGSKLLSALRDIHKHAESNNERMRQQLMCQGKIIQTNFGPMLIEQINQMAIEVQFGAFSDHLYFQCQLRLVAAFSIRRLS